MLISGSAPGGTPPEKQSDFIMGIGLDLGWWPHSTHPPSMCGIPNPWDTLAESPDPVPRRSGAVGPGEGPCLVCVAPGQVYEAAVNQ